LNVDLFEAIYGRRSIRRYTEQAIEPAVLERLLDAARWAPNASNWNAWRFVVVSSSVQKQLLLKFVPGVDDMPAAMVVICIEPTQKRVREATRLLYMADAAIAAQNIALAAHALGLGSCMVASFADVALRTVLDLPENVSPYLILTLGYPDEAPEPPPRRAIDEIAFAEQYGLEWKS
jgi:nitroreductase